MHAGLWGCHYAKADLAMARELGDQMLVLAKRQQDATLLLQAHTALGCTTVSRGEFTTSREHLDKALTFHDPARHTVLMTAWGVLARLATLPMSEASKIVRPSNFPYGSRVAAARVQRDDRASRVSSLSGRSSETAIFRASGCCWLMRIFGSNGESTEGTTRTALSPASCHASP